MITINCATIVATRTVSVTHYTCRENTAILSMQSTYMEITMWKTWHKTCVRKEAELAPRQLPASLPEIIRITCHRTLARSCRLCRLKKGGNGMNPKDGKNLMNREQAAAYLGTHPDTLWRYVQDGKIDCSPLNDGVRAHHRFLKRDLDDFLNRKRVPSLEETVEKNW